MSRRLIYVLDRFPAETLNFIYNEIQGLEARGFEIDIYSLLPEINCPEEAREFVGRTTNIRPLSFGRLLSANLFYLVRRPLTYTALLFRAFFDNNHPRKALKTLSHFAVGVVFARTIRGKKEHIHAHFAFKATLSALIASRLNGNSFSFTAHAKATVHPPDQYSIRSKIRGARFIVSISQYNRREIGKLCPDFDLNRVHIVHCGIHQEQFPFREKQATHPPRILCVGTVSERKNQEILVRACGILHERKIPFELDLVGADLDGYTSRIRTQSERLGIADRVHLHGIVDHGEIAGFQARSTVVALPSLMEGIPVSLMESMASGTPVLSTRITGVPELIEDGVSGFLASPQDPVEFADKLERLLQDDDLRRGFAEAARKKVEAEFDLKHNIAEMAAVFESELRDQDSSSA
ncbi:MAG: glycosyltransferase family 4 protein [Candidatus Krumholzibacteria bacterium]|jgi:glycosyltransferase involved in cell wall biosynthesis|nr:glycosyltransferase family 4 protein [Candidatus Krumholzibacteria bacterium]MDP6668872.1 glycosyltransferase family 4 protein [Candidatus Krumholzibacteria bacterium]MDP6797011.1 glycosyltransferase family 4 protein [Candidatus Krumholzibacteria bacterium]MDP7022222.1 glycosyltransferase family 4 protein [Candidatus Krumholzibacteria bacterium]